MRQLDIGSYVMGIDNFEDIKARLAKAITNDDDAEIVNLAGELKPALVYDVRGSLVEVLFHPQLDLPAKAALERDDLARKILKHPDNTILLEEAEYALITGSLNNVSGLGRNDVRFIRQVLEAPQVEVQAVQQPATWAEGPVLGDER